MSPSASDPIHADATVRIAAAPARVWAVLVDASGWESWYPDLRQVTASSPLETGSQLSFKTGPVAVTGEVVEAVAPSLLRFTGTSRGADAVYTFELAPDGDGTRVRAEQSMRGLAVRAMRPMLQSIADSSLAAWTAALRDTVQRRP